MTHVAAMLVWLVLCAASVFADEQYPPAGFDREDSMQCKGFTLVLYSKPPGDFTCVSQFWIDPTKTEFKRQLLFTYQNRATAYVDDAERHICIEHHETSGDNLLWLFVHKPDGLFHRVPQEMRAVGLKEFCRQTHMRLTRENFEHLDCYSAGWLKGGQIRCYIRGDSRGEGFYLKPWKFIFDAEHQKLVAHDFPGNNKAFVRD